MTVTENIKPKVVYEGTFEKGQVLYINFPYTNEEDIQCRVGTEDLIYNTEYTVEGQAITLQVDVTDAVLTIYRRTPLDQQANFPQNQRFDSAKMNEALDKICMQQQEQREWLGRCVTADISNEGFNGELPVPQGDNVLKWNGDATALENYDIIGENNEFKEEVNQNFATLSDTLDNSIEAFKEEVTLMVEEVSDAAEKINQLESAVEEAKQAATNAEAAESQAETAASIAIHQADEVKEIRDTIIPAIQEEGQTQIANIERTGFYMRDDKLYFINSQGEEEEFKAGGGGLEIGDIGIAPLGIDETKGKRRYLNGQVIIQEQYQVFADKVKSAIVLYPNLACSEEDWQATATLSAFGQCGKFVVDDVAGTIRLPKITGFIQGLNDLASLGGLAEAGLPNITGEVSNNSPNAGDQFSDVGDTGIKEIGALRGIRTTIARYAIANANNTFSNLLDGIEIDASLSNPIYGNSDTVQPESIRYPYFIQIATGSDVEVDIVNEIELNNPFSLLDYKYSEYELNNLSWLRSNGQYNSKAIYPAVYDLLLKIYNDTETKAGVSVKLSTEDYTDYDFVLNTTEEVFRLPILTTNRVLIDKKEPTSDDPTWYNLYSDGWCEQGGQITTTTDASGDSVYFLKEFTNNNYTFLASISLTSIENTWSYTIVTGSKSTSSCKIYCGQANTSSARSNPVDWQASGYVSGTATEDLTDKLYFYVGETIQNANLVNIGRIEENMVTRQSLVECATVIETYQNGTSWYRVWSDGWCEQGGYIETGSGNYTLSFLKSFINTNYVIFKTMNTSSTTADSFCNNSFFSRTVSSATTATSGAGFSWLACGYLAEERIYD